MSIKIFFDEEMIFIKPQTMTGECLPNGRWVLRNQRTTIGRWLAGIGCFSLDVSARQAVFDGSADNASHNSVLFLAHACS
ncbi:hypothetical protein [Aeromonas dhakensis]|uniref:hypothetical protein n=2 Tax=Aeromonas TaxID=642 RepID=UPI003BA09546